jgi:hypothetical protein
LEIENLACTLSGPALVQRIQDWRKVASHATARSLRDTTIVSVYPRDNEVINELRRLIDAEAECCSFMEFRLSEVDDEVVVDLRVPEEMSHVLPLLLGVAEGSGDQLLSSS